jgi:hypothetical protein
VGPVHEAQEVGAGCRARGSRSEREQVGGEGLRGYVQHLYYCYADLACDPAAERLVHALRFHVEFADYVDFAYDYDEWECDAYVGWVQEAAASIG